MASEIRANKQTNRVGLGTVTYTDTGTIVSGIVTATTFSGNVSATTVVADDFINVGSSIKLGNAGIITATSFVGSGADLTGVTQSDTPLAGSSSNTTVFYESDDETTISNDTTLSRTSSNSGVIYTKFQQVVVAPTKSLIVDAGETFVVDAYGLRTPDV